MKLLIFILSAIRFVPVFILCAVGCLAGLSGFNRLDRWCENTLHHYELLA